MSQTLSKALFICLLLLSSRLALAETAPKDPKNVVRAFFANVIEDTLAGPETIAKFVSRDYVQHVDGVTLDYKGFVDHMAAQKKVMKSMRIDIKHIIAEGDEVATLHHLHGVKRDGGIIEGQVNSYMQVRDGKIVLIDETTRLARGTEQDRDLGSRQ